MMRIWSQVVIVKCCGDCPSRVRGHIVGNELNKVVLPGEYCSISGLPIVDITKIASFCPLICIDSLAEIEHQQWIFWSSAIASVEDISKERLERWRESWRKTYNQLSEADKEADRRWSRKILAVMRGGDE